MAQEPVARRQPQRRALCPWRTRPERHDDRAVRPSGERSAAVVRDREHRSVRPVSHDARDRQHSLAHVLQPEATHTAGTHGHVAETHGPERAQQQARRWVGQLVDNLIADALDLRIACQVRGSHGEGLRPQHRGRHRRPVGDVALAGRDAGELVLAGVARQHGRVLKVGRAVRRARDDDFRRRRVTLGDR